jgi:hypothetical protein
MSSQRQVVSYVSKVITLNISLAGNVTRVVRANGRLASERAKYLQVRANGRLACERATPDSRVIGRGILRSSVNIVTTVTTFAVRARRCSQVLSVGRQ